MHRDPGSLRRATSTPARRHTASVSAQGPLGDERRVRRRHGDRYRNGHDPAGRDARPREVGHARHHARLAPADAGQPGRSDHVHVHRREHGQRHPDRAAVSDDHCSPVYVSGDAGSAGKLDVGETWTFSCSLHHRPGRHRRRLGDQHRLGSADGPARATTAAPPTTPPTPTRPPCRCPRSCTINLDKERHARHDRRGLGGRADPGDRSTTRSTSPTPATSRSLTRSWSDATAGRTRCPARSTARSTRVRPSSASAR